MGKTRPVEYAGESPPPARLGSGGGGLPDPPPPRTGRPCFFRPSGRVAVSRSGGGRTDRGNYSPIRGRATIRPPG